MAHDIKIVDDRGNAFYADWYFNPNGDIEFADDTIDQGNAVRQRCQIGGMLVRGEWPLDTDEGVPYRDVLVKNPDTGLFLGRFKEYMEGRLNVFSVDEIDFEYDSAERELGFTMNIKTLIGLEINVEA